jgi:hypothetical protein
VIAVSLADHLCEPVHVYLAQRRTLWLRAWPNAGLYNTWSTINFANHDAENNFTASIAHLGVIGHGVDSVAKSAAFWTDALDLPVDAFGR